MKVFFGGSTQRLYQKKEDYLLVRQTILDLGHSLTRDWIKLEIEGKTDTHNRYYELVNKAIKEAGAVILDYTNMTPSAGQQLLMTVERGVPILLLLDETEKTKDLSLKDFLISPHHLRFIKKEKYNPQNLKTKVARFLEWADENKTTARFNLELEKELDDYLKKKASINKSSKADEIRKLILKDMTRR